MIQEHDVSVQICVQWQGLAFAVGVHCKKVGACLVSLFLKMEGGQQAQVFEVLYVLHICALKDVVYLFDKPNDTYHCALLCLSNRM